MLVFGAPIISVFYHVRPNQLQWTVGKDGAYSQSLNELEVKKMFDVETKEHKLQHDSTTIQRWKNAISSVGEISALDITAFNG